MLASVRERRSEKKGCTLAARLLAPVALFFVQQRETNSLVETSGTFYIGLGDQFDDDRRRVHQAE